MITYGFNDSADVQASDVESLGADGMRFTLHAAGRAADATIPALGRHSVHNALAATAVALTAGMSVEDIVEALARPFSAPHRTTLIDAGSWTILDDTYNAAPDSMIAALDLLASLPGRRVAVLGEMFELGSESDAGHRTVGRHAARTADILIAVGAPADTYSEAARSAGMAPARIHIASDRAEALAQLRTILEPGDVVLLKASNGARFFDLVDELRNISLPQSVA